MLQGVSGSDPLVRIDVEAAIQEVVEEVKLLGLSIRHASRRGQQTGPQIASWLDGGQGPDGSLQGFVLVNLWAALRAFAILIYEQENVGERINRV